MSIQTTIVEAVNRAMGTREKETTLRTEDLLNMMKEGEERIEGLFNRIKTAERKVAVLQDRVQGQRDTIAKLREQLALSTRKGK